MYKICNNCVMDTTDQNINFDENGICDHCNTYYQKILLIGTKVIKQELN